MKAIEALTVMNILELALQSAQLGKQLTFDKSSISEASRIDQIGKLQGQSGLDLAIKQIAKRGISHEKNVCSKEGEIHG